MYNMLRKAGTRWAEMLLGFLRYRAGVEGPDQIFDQVKPKKLGVLDNVH